MPEKPPKCTCPHKRQSLVDSVSPSKVSNEKRQSVPSPFHQSLLADISSPKCTCSVGQKAPPPPKVRPAPLKRDMATSPNLAPKSPTIKVSSEEDEKETVESPHLEMPAVPMSSPRTDRVTRNAATSPRLEVKLKSSPLKENPNRVLEKSNSLGEKKPTRVLRNTRSLSPRPPVKHQHAITVSDENDVVSVKLSPNDEFVEEDAKAPSPKKKSRSAHASPNLSDCGSLMYEDRFANNRSTGCLVYVPSDPWLRMSEEEEAMDTLRKGRKKKKNVMRVEKSHSRPNILDDDDPWVWKGGATTDSKTRKNAYRQTKSLQSQAGEYSSLKLLPAKDAPRPKLQRSKSPILNDHEDLMSPVQKSATLSVTSANHLLPRHSFSTSPTQRDDELQLNIRRLSEQMRHSTAYNTAYDARDKFERRRTASPLPPAPPPPPVDPLLETTC